MTLAFITIRPELQKMGRSGEQTTRASACTWLYVVQCVTRPVASAHSRIGWATARDHHHPVARHRRARLATHARSGLLGWQAGRAPAQGFR